MQLLKLLINKASYGLDFLAGLVLAFTAILVVANIMGRALFSKPILGTYEMVGYLTAAVVGLALARCAVENGHIAIDFLVDRLAIKLRSIINLVINIPVMIFLMLASYHLFAYGQRIAASGAVSSTTQIIFYPFIYLVALGMLFLALVVVVKTADQFSGGERH